MFNVIDQCDAHVLKHVSASLKAYIYIWEFETRCKIINVVIDTKPCSSSKTSQA